MDGARHRRLWSLAVTVDKGALGRWGVIIPGQCCFELYLIVYFQLYLTVTSFKTVKLVPKMLMA
jgi:hypothetical protein